MLGRLPSLADRVPWVSAALMVSVLVLSLEQRADTTATGVLEDHVSAVAAAPAGGLLFLLSPVDCIDTREAILNLADSAGDEGLAVRALVVDDGVGRADLRAFLDDANRRFPHYPVSMRVAALFGSTYGIRRTPMMLAVNGTTGAITVLSAETPDRLSLAFSDEEE